MSIRKRPSNLTDRFESVDLGTYNQKPTYNAAPQWNPQYAHTKNLNVDQAIDVLSILLRDYQSKHLQEDPADPWNMWFPYAWIDLVEGGEIKNLSTNEIYKVDAIITTTEKSNYVRLTGVEPPKTWHVLRLDDKNNKTISIVPAYPDSEIKPYNFNEAGHIQNEEGLPSWLDAITYTTVREAPGSRDSKMFSGVNQELTPRYRETIDNTEIFNQMIDTEIRFDFWTRSNGDSQKLREWFRDFSVKYRWLIKYNGLSQFHWVLSYTAQNATRWRPDIIHRSASYYFRSDYSISEDLFTIKNLDLKVLVPANPDDQAELININI